MTAPQATADPEFDAPDRPRFEVFEQIAPRGVFRWRLVADSAAIVSQVGFRHPDDAHADAEAVRRAAARATVVRTLGPAGGLGQ